MPRKRKIPLRRLAILRKYYSQVVDKAEEVISHQWELPENKYRAASERALALSKLALLA